MANQSKIEIILSAVDRGMSTGLQRATAQIKGFFSASKQIESGMAGVGRAVAGVVAAVGASLSAVSGVQKLVAVSREFDKLSAGLITATGSAEGSEQSFAAIQDFATKTPYDLAQVTGAFVKLVNYGLDPSERALTSYGNTASALGKGLDQMIEAVADAATGEFERLKEFGIKAKKEGDKVHFTFRGITTTVGNNAKEIEEYLVKLGEANFADAMANRMKTLDGALSNLSDEWDKLFLNVSRSGVGDAIAEAVRLAISALEELNAMVESGELVGYLRSVATQFSGWADDAKASLALVGQWWREFTGDLDTDGKAVVDELINAFRRFPENVRAFIGLMTVEVAAGLDKAMAYAQAFKASLAAAFSDAYDVATVASDLKAELTTINTAREESVKSILDQRDATIKAAEDQRAAAKMERIAYDEQRKAAQAGAADRLAQFKIQGAASSAAAKSAKEEAKAKRETESAARKAAAEAKKEYEEQKKIAAEKLRAASQEKILALEREKIGASKLPTELERAEASLAIERRIMEERAELKRQELAAIKADTEASQADIIRAESELAELMVDNEVRLNDRLRDLSKTRMDDVERSWRRGIASAQEYQAAVREALEAGAIDQEEATKRLVASGSNMGEALALGFRNARERMQTDAEMMIAIGENLAEQLAGGMVSAWDGFINGTKSAKEALIDFARSTISWLSQIILKQMLLNALGSAGGNGSSGSGLIGAISSAVSAAGYADGGVVRGWSPSPTADNIHAWLTAREFVQPVRAVDYYGLPFMERIRRLQFPRHIAVALSGGTVPTIPTGSRLADGGMPAAGQATTVRAGDTNLRVINVLDRNMVSDHLRTADGETAIINLIRRNSASIRAILGR